MQLIKNLWVQDHMKMQLWRQSEMHKSYFRGQTLNRGERLFRVHSASPASLYCTKPCTHLTSLGLNGT